MSVNGFLRIIFISSCLCCLFSSFSFARPDKIRIVMDDNYPPFSFKDSNGKLQGILIDQWQLWERQTGIRAEIHAIDWGNAIAGMKRGEFDVIDTLFKTDERSEWLDFTKPYATIEVPIFFNKDISGITDAASLKGFIVADKRGDAMINILKQNGIENLQLFDSFESLIQAAKEHKVNVFVMGKPPALYFLNKHGIADRFRQSAPLHVNQFYRAVKKNNRELLEIVDGGFKAIPPEQLEKIDDKWYGAPLVNNFPATPFFVGVGGLSLLVLVLFIWNRTLNINIEKRTAELKSAKEILHKSEEKFRAFFEQGYYLAGLMDLDGRLTDVNDTSLQFSGAEKSDLIGKPFWDTPWWAHSTEQQMKLRQAIEIAVKGDLASFETTHPAPDGMLHYIDFSVRPVKDQSGTVIFLVPEGRDITDRKKAEEERLRLERKMLHTQKLESLGVLSGGIAHDFNNLLQVILGNLDLALMKLPQVTAARNNIDQAIKAARHAARLTNMMLAYSGKGLFVINMLNLTELVKENAAMLETAIPKSITLEQHLDPAIPTISADAGQLQQVIMNLITNAAEAIGDQVGKIKLSTGVKEFDQTTLKGSRVEDKLEAGRYVWLKVCDSGCGMDEETLQKLFDPFFTTKFTGRGLGMSAVLGIIRAHKGAFLVESRQDVGTTIQVLFPIFEDQPTEDSCPLNTEELLKDKHVDCTVKILVVDDEEMILNVSTAMLEQLGYKTLAAASGEEALAIFSRDGDSIDIVLLDQVMPGMDGVTVFKELRAIRPDIKVLLASGFSQQEVSERFTGLALNGFIPKPFTLNNLTAELSRVLITEAT
ncbi:MAG: transporter substrate-binding domain-containing protein [Geobacteraceae bacterium]|nr:transporter substrate-binding domain-containing protein [Geobacteraceae bacterium]